MKSVLFLCTGNSCRSQMAEGFAKTLLGHRFRIFSAGTVSHGLNPRAVRVMAEVGVDISKHQSKTLSELPQEKMDYVVTVCSDAHESCPYFPGSKVLHVSFDDPPLLAQLFQDEEDILRVYRRVRDEIKAMVETLAKDMELR